MLVQCLQIARRHDPLDPFESEAALNEMTSAIAAMFFEDSRSLDVRHLWTQRGLSYFRVNWWRDASGAAPRVRRSAFVVVECHEGGYRIVDVTHREAA